MSSDYVSRLRMTVTITTRQLVSHLAGIRHYGKDYMKKSTVTEGDNPDKKWTEQPTEKKMTKQPVTAENFMAKSDVTSKDPVKQSDTQSAGQTRKNSEFEFKEYYLKKKYPSVTESLKLFQDDPLVHQPGSKFLYTTHGYTLLSAVLEAAAGKSFEILIKEMFLQMGLVNTFLDENDPIIYNRGRHYIKTKKGRLQNAPYVDNSYKWAGGGILSTTRDIVKFGNIMLYSYQWRPYSTNRGQEKTAKDAANVQIKNNTKHVPGYLKHGTVEMLWTPVEKAKKKEDYYGMGWIVVPEMYSYGECRQDRQVLSHTGGAVGASSILVILPRDSVKSNKSVDETSQHYLGSGRLPQGVVVAIIVNMGEVNLTKTAVDVAKLFDKVR